MEESVNLFDICPMTCVKCKEPIDEKQFVKAVMIRTWVPEASTYVDEGPFHAECGKVRQNEISSTLYK